MQNTCNPIVVILVHSVKDNGRIVSIEHYERIAGEYRPVASKEGMYLEVIGVCG